MRTLAQLYDPNTVDLTKLASIVTMLLRSRMLGCTSLRRSIVSSRHGLQEFRLADIGEGIAEVELLKWFVKEGDSIKSFDRICEVQSDKATVEITSRYDGKIAALHHAEGSIVKVGSVLVDIHAEGVVQNKLSNVGESQTPLLGTPTEEPAPATASHFNRNGGSDRAQATPAVRKIAKENRIDLSRVTGSGPRGRILKEDVLKLTSGGHSSSSPAGTTSSPASYSHPHTPPPPLEPLPEDVRVPIRGIQRLMVKSMTAALEVQHLTYCEEVQLDNLVQLRKSLKDIAKMQNIKISYMPIVIKALSMALTQFPQLNATVAPDVTETVHHAHHNIGVAMDTPKGLIVPVIKNVQGKSIFAIAAELATLQGMATGGTLTESHLQGGTFTLSNIGSIGGTYAVPVLVVPQVAIGAMGRMQVVPRYLKSDNTPASMEYIIDNNILPKPSTIMNLSISADHRVVDGATVARFCNVWKRLLEAPTSMLAQLR